MRAMRLLLLFLLCALLRARLPSVRHAYPPRGMHALGAIEASWFVGIRHAASVAALDAVALDAPLQRDDCYLLRSNRDHHYTMMEVFCRGVQARPLEATRAHLAARYGAAQLEVERNVPMDNGFWYGNTLNTQEMIFAPRPLHMRDIAYSRLRAAFTQSGVTWGLDRTDQRAGLLNGQYDYVTNASDVDAYIVDTGLDEGHVEFQGRATFYYNAVDDIDTDCLGHGTHVAGIVGSATYGVAKAVHLIGVKVLDCSGTGSTYTIIDGLRAVLERIAQTGRRSVINLSLGGDRSPALDNALLAIASLNNTAVVVAAGNDGSDACSYSPSDLGQAGDILVVSASDYNDATPGWANRGACVDLWAPGVSILSTWIGASNTSTAVLSGTSMATPFATGVAALLLQQRPDADITLINGLMTSQATPNIVAGATGTRSLLYSLVDTSAQVPATVPTVPPAPPGIDSGAARLINYFALPFLLLYMVTQ